MVEAVAYGRCVVDGLAVRALAIVGIERPQHFLCRRQRAERMQLCVRPFLHLVQQVETSVAFIIIIRDSIALSICELANSLRIFFSSNSAFFILSLLSFKNLNI